MTDSNSSLNILRVTGKRRILLVIVIALVLSLLSLMAFRSVVRVKNMVDAGSDASELLRTAYRNGVPQPGNAALILAAENSSRLEQSLSHWGWLITVSKVVPPVGRQFSAMKAIESAIDSLVMVPSARDRLITREQDDLRGGDPELCRMQAALEDTERGFVYFQLVKTMDELKNLIEEIEPSGC